MSSQVKSGRAKSSRVVALLARSLVIHYSHALLFPLGWDQRQTVAPIVSSRLVIPCPAPPCPVKSCTYTRTCHANLLYTLDKPYLDLSPPGHKPPPLPLSPSPKSPQFQTPVEYPLRVLSAPQQKNPLFCFPTQKHYTFALVLHDKKQGSAHFRALTARTYWYCFPFVSIDSSRPVSSSPPRASSPILDLGPSDAVVCPRCAGLGWAGLVWAGLRSAVVFEFLVLLCLPACVHVCDSRPASGGRPECGPLPCGSRPNADAAPACSAVRRRSSVSAIAASLAAWNAVRG